MTTVQNNQVQEYSIIEYSTQGNSKAKVTIKNISTNIELNNYEDYEGMDYEDRQDIDVLDSATYEFDYEDVDFISEDMIIDDLKNYADVTLYKILISSK